MTLDILSRESEEEQKQMIEDNKSREFRQLNFITCLQKLNKNIDEDKAVSYLAIGTENKEILILDNFGTNILKTVVISIVKF